MDVPKHLLSPEEVEQLVAERQPRFIPLERYGPGSDATPPADSATGECPNALPLLAHCTLCCCQDNSLTQLAHVALSIAICGPFKDANVLQALTE